MGIGEGVVSGVGSMVVVNGIGDGVTSIGTGVLVTGAAEGVFSVGEGLFLGVASVGKGVSNAIKEEASTKSKEATTTMNIDILVAP
jgi:hypothetical protein